MKIENLKFPTLLVFGVAIGTPILDHLLNGTTTALSYVLEAICSIAVVALVTAGAINTFNDK